MAYSNYGKYMEAEVFGSDPVALVCMLYRGAIESTAAARRHLKAKEIRERGRQINRALDILRELAGSLDPQYEISRPLRDLYVYMQSRLIEANCKQIDEPLAEVEHLLTTLHEGWKTAIPARAPMIAAPEAAHQSVSCSY